MKRLAKIFKKPNKITKNAILSPGRYVENEKYDITNFKFKSNDSLGSNRHNHDCNTWYLIQAVI